jgi:glycerol kinase
MQSLLEGVALRASEVMAAMRELVSLGSTISVDGGMAKNVYFVQFLANALAKTVVVPSSTDLTGLGAARMAMLGAGLKTLPPLPPPARLVEATIPLEAQSKRRFAEALARAKSWKKF